MARRSAAPVDFTSNAVSNQSGTIELRATFPNADLSLVPGQLVNVTVQLNDIPGALVVPRDAVNDSPNGSFVFVVKDGKADQVPVSVLTDDGTNAAVSGALAAGDKVVVEGQLRVDRRRRGAGAGRRKAAARCRASRRASARPGAMNISAQFIKRPVMTCLVMAALVIFGLFGYAILPVSELPNVDFPTINVQANLPGADPETMASAVATPLENAFASVPGLDTMTSRSPARATPTSPCSSGWTAISTAPPTDVQAAISGVLRRLPRNMPNPPTLRKNDPSQQPIFFVSLYSDTVPISKVDQYARSLLATQLSTLDGVAQVNIFGQARYAVRIQADPAALAARHMTLLDLADCRQRHQHQPGLGHAERPHQERHHPRRRPARQCRGLPQAGDRLSRRRGRSPSAMSPRWWTVSRMSARSTG